MKAFQNVRFDLFNSVLLWATHTGEEQNKAVFFFSPLIHKAAASSPYAIHCCLLRIYTFFFFVPGRNTVFIQPKLVLFWRNQAVSFGSVWIYCVK